MSVVVAPRPEPVVPSSPVDRDHRPDLVGRWPLLAVVAAAAGIVTGLIWDISWHRSIGRDTLFSPPHVLEYISAVVAGVTCGYVVLRTTLAGTEAQRGASVRFWGFRGPLGAWVTIWGTFTMLVSAPFDDWWHNAYGLDVQIISPPHIVLLVGMLAVIVGAMLMVLASQNRMAASTRVEATGGSRADQWLFGVAGGITLLMVVTATMQYTGFANYWHGSRFYRVAAACFPLVLVAVGRSGRLRWPATTAALVYMGATLLAAWVLQLVPATPKLPPILNPIDRMVPPPFPMLLVVPGLFIDLVLRRGDGGAAASAPRARWGRDVALAGVLGVGFVALMVAVHWPFAEFLLTPAAENFVFFQGRWDYNVGTGPGLRQFWQLDSTPDGAWSAGLFARGLGTAALLGAASSLAGLRAGAWMRGVQR
jgi:hypothetical protein